MPPWVSLVAGQTQLAPQSCAPYLFICRKSGIWKRGAAGTWMWQFQLIASRVSSQTLIRPFPWVTDVEVSLGTPVISSPRSPGI